VVGRGSASGASTVDDESTERVYWPEMSPEMQQADDAYAMRFMTQEDWQATKKGAPLGYAQYSSVPAAVYGALKLTSHPERRKLAELAAKVWPSLDVEWISSTNKRGHMHPVPMVTSFTSLTGAHLLSTYSKRSEPLWVGDVRVAIVQRSALGPELDAEGAVAEIVTLLRKGDAHAMASGDQELIDGWFKSIAFYRDNLRERQYTGVNLRSIIAENNGGVISLSIGAAVGAGVSVFEAAQAYHMLCAQLGAARSGQWMVGFAVLARPQLQRILRRMGLQDDDLPALKLMDLGVMYQIELRTLT
jgi:hypothetical protein